MKETKPSYDNKTIYKNSILSVIYKFGSTFITFLTTPLLLFILGEEKYGAWATLLSIVSWIYYCDIGIGGAMRNKLAVSIAKDDYISARKYVSVSYATVTIISVVLLCIVFVFTQWFDICNFLEIKIHGEDLNLCLRIGFLFACINFVASLANNILYAMQRAAAVSLFGIIAQLLFLVMLVIYMLTGVKTIFYVAIGEGVCQLLKNIIEIIYVHIKYPQLRFTLNNIDWSYSKGIVSFGIMMFIGQLAALILNTTDNLVISKYVGVAEVTPYNFCYKYFNIINSVYVALITPLLSAYTMAYQKRDKQWVNKTVKKNVFLYIVFVVGSIVAALIFESFSRLWLQKDLNYEAELIISTLVYFLLLMFNHIWSTILVGFGYVKESTLMTIFGSVVNIPLSIFLATECGFGVTGVVLGSAISLLFSTFLYPFIAIKKIKSMESVEENK